MKAIFASIVLLCLTGFVQADSLLTTIHPQDHLYCGQFSCVLWASSAEFGVAGANGGIENGAILFPIPYGTQAGTVFTASNGVSGIGGDWATFTSRLTDGLPHEAFFLLNGADASYKLQKADLFVTDAGGHVMPSVPPTNGDFSGFAITRVTMTVNTIYSYPFDQPTDVTWRVYGNAKAGVPEPASKMLFLCGSMAILSIGASKAILSL